MPRMACIMYHPLMLNLKSCHRGEFVPGKGKEYFLCDLPGKVVDRSRSDEGTGSLGRIVFNQIEVRVL